MKDQAQHTEKTEFESGNSKEDGLSLVSLVQNQSSKELLSLNKWEKSKIVMSEAASSILPGMADAVLGIDQIPVPLTKDTTVPVPKIVESAAIGAAIGFAARTLLPQAGILGKLGGAALATAFTAPLAIESYQVYKKVDQANGIEDLQNAGRHLGFAAGGFAANLPLGIAAYKAGSLGSDKFLATNMMKDFGIRKTELFDRANNWTSDRFDDAAALAKNFLAGKKEYPGSHGVIEKYPRVNASLNETLKGTDYPLPKVKLDPSLGVKPDGTKVNVLVVTGHGVEAPEFTEVVKALRQAGTNITVATPDWTWQYQPNNPGLVSAAKWLKNDQAIQGDISVSSASQMMKNGKFDVMYVPGGAGNTAGIRTDAGVLDLVRQSLQQKLDTWTICHGGQVLISSEALPRGTRLTGSADITAQDLPNAGFLVPKDNVVFDITQKLLSAKDPSVMDDFISAIGQRLKVITGQAKESVLEGTVKSTKPSGGQNKSSMEVPINPADGTTVNIMGITHTYKSGAGWVTDGYSPNLLQPREIYMNLGGNETVK